MTALRRARPGHVALEVDGRPWRTVPDEVVVRVGLAAGIELDRPLLRRFRRELRAAEARAIAARALARRDLSARRLEERLAQARIRQPTAEATVARLAEVGLVDDARLACTRAAALAAAGWGDAAILARLGQERIDEGAALEALAVVPPERERARRLAGGVGRDRARAIRLLVRRGFSEDAIEYAAADLQGDDPLDEPA